MTPQLAVTYRSTAGLVPFARNSRTHDEAQVLQLVASIREFGFTNPVLVDSDGGIIAGHGRVQAAQVLGLADVPTIELAGLSDAQKRAYVIADNKLALNAGWDDELLLAELNDLADAGYDLALTGFDAGEIAALADEFGKTQGRTDPDEIPELQPVPVSKIGDVWTLGLHRVMCGDSTAPADVLALMGSPDVRAPLLHSDPPYGMGKEADGIANDNLYREKLDGFQMAWWRVWRKFMADNASAYVWGHAPDLWRLWYVGGLADSERLEFRNEIVWDKKAAGAAGMSQMGQEGMRQFPNATERCLFFMLGAQGFNNNADNYWEGWDPVRGYLEAEMKKCGWTVKDLNRITGTNMGGHWVTRSQWAFITAEHYQKIQEAARDHEAFKRDHEALKRDHEALKRDFYVTRAHFDNAHDVMRDVWEFSRVTGDDRHDHAAPKPVAMMERVMASSCPPGGLCLEPFGGSGSTLIGAETSGRTCYAMELQTRYVDVIVRRWQAFTGNVATLENDGRTFAEVSDGR